MADKDWWKDDEPIGLDNPFLSDERRKELERIAMDKELENNPFRPTYE